MLHGYDPWETNMDIDTCEILYNTYMDVTWVMFNIHVITRWYIFPLLCIPKSQGLKCLKAARRDRAALEAVLELELGGKQQI